PFAEALGENSLFEQALAGIDDDALLATLSASLVALLNRVLVADRVDAADVELVRETTARVRDTLSLELDHLAGGDGGRAVDLLTQVALTDVFRVGYSLTAALARRARALDRAGVIDPNVDALIGARPLFPGALDAQPVGGERPFRSIADLDVVDVYLKELESRPVE